MKAFLRILAIVALSIAPAPPQQLEKTAAGPLPPGTTLHYGIEWRMVRAGNATFRWSSSSTAPQADVHIESTGLVSKLFKVKDDYRVRMSNELCAAEITIHAEEGKRRRETRIQFDAAQKKATYLERDLIKNTVVASKEIETPPCVHDYIGALSKLRTLKVEPGQAVQLPVSDGKKFAMVRAEAQEREEVKTPTGTHKTVRYEVLIFNDVIVPKKARLFVWLTDDARKLPVQIRVRLSVLVGTITLHLEKEESN